MLRGEDRLTLQPLGASWTPVKFHKRSNGKGSERFFRNIES